MGKRIQDFNSFSRDFIRESQDAQAAIQSALTKRVWSDIFTSNYLTESEKIVFSNFLNESNIDFDNIDESMWDTIKSGVEKLKDAGTSAGKAISDKIGKAIDGAKSFASYIGDLIKKSWTKLIEFFKKKFANVKGIIKKDYEKATEGVDNAKEKLNDELYYLQQTALYWTTEVPKLIIDTIKGAFTKEIVKECLTNNGNILNELSVFDPIKMDEMVMKALNEADDTEEADAGDKKEGAFSFLNDMAHAVSKFPPFKWLHALKGAAEKGFKLILKNVSDVTKKVGGPGVFDFALVSLIAAGAFEYWAKGKLTEPVKDILTAEPIMRLIPMGKTLITAIEWTALILLIIETVGELSGNEDPHEPKAAH